ncbi:MAG: hypothetical protein R6X02_14370 [Enhygromyxa sp.]
MPNLASEAMEREPAPGERRSPSPGRAFGWLAVLLVVFTGLRLWQLELDAPAVVVPGYSGQAHFRDEPAKAHEARNKAKWDRWSLSDADDYGFWRSQSPTWVWGEYYWFRAFGVGLVQARSFVVVQTIIALALLMWLALIRHGLPAAVATGLLLGLNWAYLVYSRLALMEGALICWLLVATIMLSQLERNPARAGLWSMSATASMLIACMIKQTGLLLVPAFAVALLLLGLRAAGVVGAIDDRDAAWRVRLGARLRRREAQASVLAIAVLAVALGLLVFNPDYQDRLEFNAAHFTVAAHDQPILKRAARTLVRGLFGARIQLMFNRLAPLALWLATVELARQLIVLGRRWRARKRGEPAPRARGLLEGPVDTIDLWMLAWAILALLANLASPHRAIRFQLILVPPAAWLAGALVSRAWLHQWPSLVWTRGVRAGLVMLALLGTTLTGMRFTEWMRSEQASAASIGAELEDLIGEREAVVIGEFAAQAVFETEYQHFYVRPNQFNFTPEILRALAITHVITADPKHDRIVKLLKKEVPDLLDDWRKLGTIEFRGQTLEVWELAPPPTAPGPDQGT